jgi:hypothetical protein
MEAKIDKLQKQVFLLSIAQVILILAIATEKLL